MPPMKSVRILWRRIGTAIPAIRVVSPDKPVIATTGTATYARRFIQKTKFAPAATGVAKKNASVSHRMKPVRTTGIVRITERKPGPGTIGITKITKPFVITLGLVRSVLVRIQKIGFTVAITAGIVNAGSNIPIGLTGKRSASSGSVGSAIVIIRILSVTITGIAKHAIPCITKTNLVCKKRAGIALSAMHKGYGGTIFVPAVADDGIAKCVKKFMPVTKPARIIWLYSLTITSLSIFSGFRAVVSGHARNVENTSRGVKVVRTTGVVPVIRDARTDSRTAETTFGVVLCAGKRIRPKRSTAITAGMTVPSMRSV